MTEAAADALYDEIDEVVDVYTDEHNASISEFLSATESLLSAIESGSIRSAEDLSSNLRSIYERHTARVNAALEKVPWPEIREALGAQAVLPVQLFVAGEDSATQRFLGAFERTRVLVVRDRLVAKAREAP